jgi:hypothetical protein
MVLVRRMTLLVVVLAAFSRLPASRTHAAEPAGATPPADRNVVIVTMDGLRWQEVFGGAQEPFMDDRSGGVRDVLTLRRRFWRETPEQSREAVMPFFWTVVAKQGQVFGDPARGSRAALTNGLKFSYPGYHEILCGFPDPRVNSNDKVPNPNVTVLEWLNGRPAFRGKVAAFGTWDVLYSIVNVERAGIPMLSGWDPSRDEPLTEREKVVNDLLPDLPRIWPDNAFDVVTQRLAMEYLRKHKPRVLYVMLGETDEWAHLRRYDCYLDAAHRGDDFIRKLWETLQSMPEYAGRTSLVLTTDHGRGATKENWTDHGKDVEGAEQIWIGVLGPDTPALGAREKVQVTQGQVAATAAALVGEDYHAAQPKSAAPLPGATRAAAQAAAR